jgi:hypothetical protein
MLKYVYVLFYICAGRLTGAGSAQPAREPPPQVDDVHGGQAHLLCSVEHTAHVLWWV